MGALVPLGRIFLYPTAKGAACPDRKADPELTGLEPATSAVTGDRFLEGDSHLTPEMTPEFLSMHPFRAALDKWPTGGVE